MCSKLKISSLILLGLILFNPGTTTAQQYKTICISENGRFLQYEDGTPFFYLGDTAWELFHRLNREEAAQYLEDRAQKGFTVIQAVALAEHDGLNVPNAYGDLPFDNYDPTIPATQEGPNNDYWDHVDYIVEKANSLGLWMGILPTWGRYWKDGNTPLFNEQNAESYGEFIAKRYKDAQVIWILGGDRNIDNETQKRIIQAMARGLERGDGGRHLITYHPTGWSGSAQWFHNDPLFDFNMRQNGHEVVYDPYARTLDDYLRTPAKPVIDGEPVYEDHPIAFQAPKRGHSTAADVRAALYWDLFNGACGHTYGHHSIWQMYDPEKRPPHNMPLLSWHAALDAPGAKQMVYGRNLIESRPYFTRIPAPDVIIASDVPTAIPGAGSYRFTATADTDGTYIMVYAPIGRKFTVKTSGIRSERLRAWWYNPRNGKAEKIGTFDNSDSMEFISPTPGEHLDWILVIDDAHKKYPAPGKKMFN